MRGEPLNTDLRQSNADQLPGTEISFALPLIIILSVIFIRRQHCLTPIEGKG